MERLGPRARSTAAFAAALRSRYWCEEDARAVLAEYRASGQALKTFCRAHDVGVRRVRRLRWWRERLPREDAAAESAPRFVPVQVAPAGGPASFEVVLPGGALIRIGADFDGGGLRRLLAVLADAPC
jgi:hypothetical protein